MADPFPDPRRPAPAPPPSPWPGAATTEQPRTRADARRVLAAQPAPQRGSDRQRAAAPSRPRQSAGRHPVSRARPERDPRPARRPRRWPRAVLPVCALVLAGWSATCLVDADPSAVAVLAAATPAVAVFAVPLLALAVHRHRYLVLAMALTAAILPWAMVGPYAVGGPGPSVTRDARTLQVMTLNARLGRAHPAEVVDAVRVRAVDLLVITELTSPLAHELTVSGLRRYLRPLWVDVSAAPAGGIGIWARDDGAQPPREPGSVAAQRPTTAPEPVPVAGTSWPAASTTAIFGGRPISVTALHVRPPGLAGSGDWHADLAALEAAMEPISGPRLVVGDLAATPWNAPFRRLSAAGVEDAANVAGGGLRATWPSWSPVPVTALDHVLVGGGIAVRSVSTQRVAGTDHLALIATLAVPAR